MSTSLPFPGAPPRAADDRTERAGATAGTQDPLDVALHEAWRGLDRAHPSWGLPPHIFMGSARARLAECGLYGEAAQARLSSLALDDLYLVIACMHGDRHALEAFFSTYDPFLTGCFRRWGAPPWQLEDLVQALRASLFTPRPTEGSGPRLAHYAGRGSLRGWLNTAVRRQVTDAWRRRASAPVQAPAPESAAPDAESHDLTEAHEIARRLAALVQEGLDALSPADRNLLLKHRRDGVCLREIGEELGVVPSTVQRRVKALEARLGATVLQAAHDRLGIDANTVRRSLDVLAKLVRLDDLLVSTLWLFGSLQGRR